MPNGVMDMELEQLLISDAGKNKDIKFEIKKM